MNCRRIRTTATVLMLLTANAAMAEEVRRDLYGDPLPVGALMRLGTVRFRHGASHISCLAFTPDGQRLASGGVDHLIHFWDVRTGAELRRLAGHRGTVRALSFSPDGKLLASAGDEDGTVRLWDVATGRLLRTLQHDQEASSVAFFPDGKSLITSDNEKERIHFWSAATGECWRTLEVGEEGASPLALSPNGKWLATGWKKVRLWDVASGKTACVLEEQVKQFDVAGFTPDSKKLVMADNEGWIYLWDVKTRALARKIKTPQRLIRALLLSPDGRTLLLGYMEGAIYRWDMDAEKEPLLLGQSSWKMFGLSLSPDGKTLASAGCGNVIRLWDLTTGRRRFSAKGHDYAADRLRFAAKDETLLSTSLDGTARNWDLATGEQLRHEVLFFQGSILASWLVDLSMGDRIIAARAEKKTVRLQELARKKTLASFEMAESVEKLSFSRDGKVLAITSAKHQVEVWDVATRRRRCCVPGYSSPTLSGDGRWLVAFAPPEVLLDNTPLHLWDTLSGKELWHISSPEKDTDLFPRCFSPDNRMLACWESPQHDSGKQAKRALVVWEVRTGRQRLRLDDYGENEGISFSPDSRLLAFGGGDETIHVLDVRTGEERACFRGGQGLIYALAFSNTGRTLASSGEDTTILLWPLPRTGSARPARRLSAEELRSLWTDLASEDGARAFRAMRALHAAPASPVEYLHANLQPIRVPDAGRVKRLLADLDADTFEVREQTSRQLAQIAEGAEPLLRQALREGPSLEVRRRIQRLLDALAVDSPERWRCARAVEVLEWLDTNESRRLLEELADGAADARLTREAKAALTRRTSRLPGGASRK